MTELFSEEATAPPTLEEVQYDEMHGEWLVTLGVRRPSNYVDSNVLRDPLGAKSRVFPDYKVVRISDKDGKVVAVAIRSPV